MEKMNESDISVIIPAHNEGLHIGKVVSHTVDDLINNPWLC